VTFIAFSGVAVAECRSYSVDRDVITCRGARFIVKPSDAHRWKRDRDTKDAEHPGTGDLAFIPPSESDAVRIVDSYVYAFSVSGDTLRTIAFMNDKGRVMQIVTGETT
jgi:hypothetical protein